MKQTSHADRARSRSADRTEVPPRQRARPHPTLTIQRTAGNAAVARALGRPAPGEEGARRAADAAVEGPSPRPAQTAPVPPGAETAIRGTIAGGGRPLDSRLRNAMEQRFGQDFSGVRLHTGGAAAAAAASVSADAFALGSDVVFAAGRYRPDTGPGLKLIVHELAHVIQQRETGPELARQSLGDPLGLYTYPPVETYDPLEVVDPSAVVVTGAGVGPRPDDPLAAYPTLSAALAPAEYELLRAAARARVARRPGRVAVPVTVPLEALTALDAQYLPADFSAALVPHLVASSPNPQLVAFVMRNEIVRRLITRSFPPGTTAAITVVDPAGREPGPLRLAFTINGRSAALGPDGFFHLAQLNDAAGNPLDSLRTQVVADAERIADYATLVVRARRAIDRGPGLASGVLASPEDYSLGSVRAFRNDLTSLTGDISTYSSDLVSTQQMAELHRLRDQVAPLVAPIERALVRVEQLHEATAKGVTTEEGARYLEKLGSDADDGSWLGTLRQVFWAQAAARQRLAGGLTPGSGAIDAATLAYRRGDISLTSFHSILTHQFIRMEIGMAVGLAAGLLGGLLGGAAGGAIFGAETLGASVTAGATGGFLGATGQLASEDIYGATVAAVSSDPAVAASMRSRMHSAGQYVFAGTTGTLLGAGFGALTFTPRPPAPPGSPVALYDASGQLQLVQGGKILPRPGSTAPVTLWTSPTESVVVQGGQVLPQSPPVGPTRLFGPTGQTLLVQGGQIVPPPSTTPLTGGTRFVTPQGQPIVGTAVPLPAPQLLDPNYVPITRPGPLIVDAQSGQAAFLRNVTAGATGRGVGIESGDWLLGYQGFHPTNPGDLSLARQIVRASPVWPSTPASQTSFDLMPRAFGWEMDPAAHFWPQSGRFTVRPEPFFPAVGGQGRLIPRGFEDVTAIQPTTHPELRGLVDQVYLRRPFALAQASPDVTGALGRELNSMLRPGGFIELRLTRQGEFSVPTAGNPGANQLAVVAAEVEGATIVRVDRGAIEAFGRGQIRPGLTSTQVEMLQGAAADLGGAGALGQGDIVRIIRIYKGPAH